MKRLSITRAWEEAARFVRDNAGIVYTISFAMLVLPLLLLQASVPRVQPGQQPPAGPWLFWLIPMFVLAIVGTSAICLLGTERISLVRAALGQAARRFPAALGALLLLFLLFVLLTIPLLALVPVQPDAPASMVRFLFVQLVLALAIAARFFVLAPVSSIEPNGPVAALRRSFRLTSGNFWRLFGFLFVAVMLFLVISSAVTLALGSVILLLVGPPQPGSFSSFLLTLLNGVLLTVFLAYFTAMVARIYVQLSEDPPVTKGS